MQDYQMRTGTHGWLIDSTIQHMMGEDRCLNTLLYKATKGAKSTSKQPAYSSAMMIFDDGKVLRKRNLLYAADELGGEIYDAVLLAKRMCRYMHLSDEELKANPIVVITGYYAKNDDFAKNEIAAQLALSKLDKSAYSALIVNVTPCVDYSLLHYFDESKFDEANARLAQAYKDSKNAGFYEAPYSFTQYAVSRYVIKQPAERRIIFV